MSYSPNIVVSMLFSNLFSIRFSTNRKQVPEKPGVFRFVQVPLSCQARSDINASTLAGAVGWCGGGVMTFITTFPIPVMDIFPAPILGPHDAVGRLNKCKCRKNTSESSRNSSFRSPCTHGWRMGGSRFFAVPDKQRSFFLLILQARVTASGSIAAVQNVLASYISTLGCARCLVGCEL